MFQKNMKILSSNLNNSDLSKNDLKKVKKVESGIVASSRKNNESTGKLQTLLRKKVLENL